MEEKWWLKFHKGRICEELSHLTKDLITQAQGIATHHTYFFEILKLDGLLIYQRNVWLNVIKLSFRVFMHLLDTENKLLVGRRYDSDHVHIDINQEATSYNHQKLKVGFHTKCYPLNLVIEIVVYDLDPWNGSVLMRQSVGWQSIQFLKQIGSPFSIQLLQGTPKVELIDRPFQVKYKDKFSVTCQVFVQKSPSPLCYVVEECCIVGTNETVYGLDPPQISEEMQNSQKGTAWIDEAVVTFPKHFEKQIEDAMPGLARYKYKSLDNKETVNFRILNRRLVVCQHNGWMAVNDKKFSNFVRLVEEQTDNPLLTKLKFQGKLEINNIPVYGSQVNGLFIVMLEYEVDLHLAKMGKATELFCLGWAPLYLERLKGQKVEVELFSAKTPDFRPCFKFSQAVHERFMKDNYKKLSAKFVEEYLKKEKEQENESDEGENEPKRRHEVDNEIRKLFQMPVCESLINVELDFDFSAVETQLYEPEAHLETLATEKKQIDEALNDKRLKVQSQQQKIFQLQQKISYLIEEQKRDDTIAAEYEEQITQLRERELQYLQLLEQMSNQFDEEKNKTIQQFQELALNVQDVSQKQKSFVEIQRQDQRSVRQVNLYDDTDQKTTILKSYSEKKTGFMLSSDAQSLLDSLYDQEYEEKMKNYQKYFEDEFVDMKTIRHLIVRILSYKPKIPTKGDISDVHEEKQNWIFPSKLKLTVNYFDFPPFHSDNLCYFEPLEKVKLQIAKGEFAFLIKEQYKKRQSEHKIEALSFKVAINEIEGVEDQYLIYTMFKSLFIRVYDAETLHQIGYCQMPLRKLLLEGNHYGMTTQELQVFSVDWKTTHGFLNVTLEMLSEQSDVEKSNTFPSKIMNFTHKENKQKIKVEAIKTKLHTSAIKFHSSKPIANEIVDVKKSRIQERIRQIKQSQLSQIKNKQSQIMVIKDLGRSQILQSVLSKDMESSQEVHLRVGHMKVVLVDFENSSDHPQEYVITIKNDFDAHCSIAPFEEILYCESILNVESYRTEIIFENDEYRCTLPGQSKGDFFLKFQTYKKPTIDNPQIAEIIVLVQQKINSQPVGGSRYVLIPHYPITDMVFDFYEQSHTEVQFTLPPLFCFANVARDKYPHLICTSKSVQLGLSDFGEMTVALTTPDIGQSYEFSIYAYRDEQRYENVGGWDIIVHTMQGITLQVPMGKLTRSAITFYSDKKRTVRLYSNQNDTLKFEVPWDNEIEVEPSIQYQFFFTIFTVIDVDKVYNIALRYQIHHQFSRCQYQ